MPASAQDSPNLPRTAHLSHICFFECMKTNENTSSTTHASVGHPARAEIARTVANPLEAHCIHVCTKFPQSLHETALCSSLTETLSLCKQTLRHGKLHHALAGSLLGTSRHRLALRCPYLRVEPQQLWACQIIAHGWPGSLGRSRKPSLSLL